MAQPLKAVARWLRGATLGRAVAARIGAFYIRLVMKTTRWQRIGFEHRSAAIAHGGGLIAAIWHGRLFASATLAPRHRRVVAMISNNRDGDLISAVVGRFGVYSVRGSTYDREKKRDKGGQIAFRDAYEELTKRLALVAITPDGPRGPRMQAQAGIAALAVDTGSPVLPVAFSVRRGRFLRNWDRFLVPWPFGRGVIIYGELLVPPVRKEPGVVEAFRQQVEAALIDITQQADSLCGHDPSISGPVVPREQ